MTRSTSPGEPGAKASAAKWSAAAALAVAAGALLWAVGSGAADDARAGSASAAAAGDSILIVAGQVTGDSYGLYLVDTKSSTMCVYQWVPSSRKLRLMAARNFRFDLQLDDYNNDKETSPAEIRTLVEQQRRLSSSTQPN